MRRLRVVGRGRCVRRLRVLSAPPTALLCRLQVMGCLDRALELVGGRSGGGAAATKRSRLAAADAGSQSFAAEALAAALPLPPTQALAPDP